MALLVLAPVPQASAEQANGPSSATSLSGDGRFVAFGSNASNLSIDADTNGVSDVFVRDRGAGFTTRVSVSSAGAQADSASYNPSVSDDGRYVAFESDATNLVPGDTNGVRDVFVADLQTGETRRASVTSTGAQIGAALCGPVTGPAPGQAGAAVAATCDAGGDPSISGDGRYVAFVSQVAGVTGGGEDGQSDVYVYDQTTGTTVDRVSAPHPGSPSSWGGGDEPSVSKDGRYVALRSTSAHLIASGDTNGVADVFLRDRTAATTSRLSISDTGTQANGQSYEPSVSDDGRYVAYGSVASNLQRNGWDTNGLSDVYVRDRSLSTTEWASQNFQALAEGASHSPSISGNGPYVAFASDSRLRMFDTNGTTDIYEFDFVARTGHSIISHDEGRGQANARSRLPSTDSAGTYATYVTDATNLFSTGDTNGVADIAVHQWADVYSPAGPASRRRRARARASHCSAHRRQHHRWHVHRHFHMHRRGAGGRGSARRRHVHRRVHFHRAPVRQRGRLRARSARKCQVGPASVPASAAVRAAARVLRGCAREKASDNVEKLLRGCGTPIWHYTELGDDPGERQRAKEIYDTRNIVASGPRQGQGGTYPSGAYGTTIRPDEPGWTQEGLAQYLFGDSAKPTSGWVMFCSKQNPSFQRTDGQVPFDAPDDYWHAPKEEGQEVPIVQPVAWGENKMPSEAPPTTTGPAPLQRAASVPRVKDRMPP